MLQDFDDLRHGIVRRRTFLMVFQSHFHGFQISFQFSHNLKGGPVQICHDKTSLRRNFMGGRFRRTYIPTVGADFSYKEQEIDNKMYQLLMQSLDHLDCEVVILRWVQTQKEPGRQNGSWLKNLFEENSGLSNNPLIRS